MRNKVVVGRGRNWRSPVTFGRGLYVCNVPESTYAGACNVMQCIANYTLKYLY